MNIIVWRLIKQEIAHFSIPHRLKFGKCDIEKSKIDIEIEKGWDNNIHDCQAQKD